MILLAQLWAMARQRPGVALCLLVAVLAGAGNYPLWLHRQEVAQRHDEVRRRGEAMLAALTDRSRINEDLQVLAEAHEVIDRNLVSESSMEVNLGYFYRLEKINRVRLTRIDQMVSSPAAAGSPFKTVPVSLQLTGSYRNLLGFVRDLETGPRIMRVRGYRFERTSLEGGDMLLQLSVELLAQS